MKRLFLVLSLFMPLMLLARPNLYFPKTYVPMDTVSFEQGVIECDVPYINTGDSPLYITKAQSMCPCTVATFSEEALLPGDTAYVHLKFTFVHDGEYSNYVRLYYNAEDEDDNVRFAIYGYLTPLKPKEQE